MTKLGIVAIRIAARFEGVYCSPHAIRKNGSELPMMPRNTMRPKRPRSRGIAWPLARAISSSIAAPIAMRPTASDSGGSVSTASLMK